MGWLTGSPPGLRDSGGSETRQPFSFIQLRSTFPCGPACARGCRGAGVQPRIRRMKSPILQSVTLVRDTEVPHRCSDCECC